MLEIKADLWSYPADFRCVPTNGIVKPNGCLVMGAGVAKVAAEKYPQLPDRLGRLVTIFGNKPFFFNEIGIISFPTKNHFKDPSDIGLIIASAKEIAAFVEIHDKTIVLPRVGTGFGGLNWIDVKAAIEPIFDDNRFIVCSL